jgi:hypothetical protein
MAQMQFIWRLQPKGNYCLRHCSLTNGERLKSFEFGVSDVLADITFHEITISLTLKYIDAIPKVSTSPP